ncbi:hypothetical protein [Sutcliffiella horikoshii]|uniref:Uncharacterized protein n=1 Tax=Sutcliffiella horikoshii TaxID=79883 RepID=A0A5D4SYF6_9BACI|nr:hypothetical protein [Sutcliffiella horikoshii]TYS67989.1 hypothetical protein FZC75_18495 [Sutcliffiella horikoshii]
MAKPIKWLIVTSIAIVLVFSLFTFTLFKESRGYTQYHSESLMNDTSRLIGSFQRKQEVLQQIIQTRTLTQTQVELISEDNYTLINYYEDYNRLAMNLDRYENKGYSIVDAAFVTEAVFNRKIAEIQGTDQVKVKLDNEFLEKVEFLEAFNERCLNTLGKHVRGFVITDTSVEPTEEREELSEKGINEDFWVEILKRLDREAFEKQRDLEMLVD